MFRKEIYIERRQKLKLDIKNGVGIFLGNSESPMNYAGNTYNFRQDSNFLYFWGIDEVGFAAIIDFDSGEEIIFSDDRSMDDIIWMGPTRSVAEKAENVGVTITKPFREFEKYISKAIAHNRIIHLLPQYRAENSIFLSEIFNCKPNEINKKTSLDLIKAIIKQRSIKSHDEVFEIEKALETSFMIYNYAFRKAKPGIREQEISGGIEGIAHSRGRGVSFPTIFSIHGEILHNHHHKNIMRNGDLVVLDSGAESFMHYASDITRSFPVSGKFTSVQKDIYQIVLETQTEAIKILKPGISYKEVHLHAAKTIVKGMKNIGLMKGNTEDAVESGAHALFFPHGLGHMLGLDVHDMEDLGENLVGYDDSTSRSEQFGLAFLRLARPLQPGFVLTVEPGVYFISALIDQWRAENKKSEFINYEKLEKMIGFGGIRIEDDVLITEDSCRVLGRPIPKSVEEIEEICQN